MAEKWVGKGKILVANTRSHKFVKIWNHLVDDGLVFKMAEKWVGKGKILVANTQSHKFVKIWNHLVDDGLVFKMAEKWVGKGKILVANTQSHKFVKLWNHLVDDGLVFKMAEKWVGKGKILVANTQSHKFVKIWNHLVDDGLMFKMAEKWVGKGKILVANTQSHKFVKIWNHLVYLVQHNPCSLQFYQRRSLKILWKKEVILATKIFSPSSKIFLFLHRHIQNMSSLTHYQTANSRLFQIERLCRRQFRILRKWQKVIQSGRKHCGKRRNCSLRAISPFPTVF